MSSIISVLTEISQQVIIYIYIPILIAGVIGGIFNLIIFLSLKTFRENSCAFYLIIMSFFNIGQLLTGELSRLMTVGYNIDWTLNSLFYCKIRWYCIQMCSLTSYACLCFATIDQYLATSSRNHWQQWSNIKLAHRLCLLAFIISVLHGIPSIFYYNYDYSVITTKSACIITNVIFQQYKTYGFILLLAGILPVFITVLFGSLAYRNVKQLAYRTVPLVRRELDKQLTSIVLVQVVYTFIVIVPYIIVATVQTSLNSNNDPILAVKLQFAEYLAAAFYYSYFAVSIICLIIIVCDSSIIGSILYLYLCIKTISTTINLCA
jgi:hypothetical protein